MLYLIATPIGNLEDITYRAVRLLKEADLILCEDKRRTTALLSHYSIESKLLSYHLFSEAKLEEEIVQRLRAGQTIALISDAGTPGISDPGHRLVVRCRAGGLPLSSIPGPCAAIAALTSSSLPTDRFHFIGFLPRKEGEQRRLFAELFHGHGTLVGYESPNRLAATLRLLAQIAPRRRVAVARELTKLYEEVQEGSAEEMADYWSEREVRGEIVLLIGDEEGEENWLDLSPADHVAWLVKSFALERGEAIKLAAQLRGLSKSALYKELHSPSKEGGSKG